MGKPVLILQRQSGGGRRQESLFIRNWDGQGRGRGRAWSHPGWMEKRAYRKLEVGLAVPEAEGMVLAVA